MRLNYVNCGGTINELKPSVTTTAFQVFKKQVKKSEYSIPLSFFGPVGKLQFISCTLCVFRISKHTSFSKIFIMIEVKANALNLFCVVMPLDVGTLRDSRDMPLKILENWT